MNGEYGHASTSAQNVHELLLLKYGTSASLGRSLPVAAQHPELPLSARNQSYRPGFLIFKSERLLLRQQQTKNLVNYRAGIRQKSQP